MRRLLGLLAVLTVAGLALAACGGGGNDGGGAQSPALTEAQAQTVVNAALLNLDDLPTGASWTLVPDDGGATDQQANSDDPFSQAPSCGQFADLTTGAAGEIGGAKPLVAESHEFEASDDATLTQRQLFSAAAVYPSSDDTATAFDGLRSILDADALNACFKDAFGIAFAELGDIKFDASAEAAPGLPADSVGSRLTINVDAQGLPLSIGADVRATRRSNAVAFFFALEINSDIATQAAPDLFKTMTQRLEDALVR